MHFVIITQFATIQYGIPVHQMIIILFSSSSFGKNFRRFAYRRHSTRYYLSVTVQM